MEHSKIKNTIFAALLCALLCISAFISFPLPPFPGKFTLQVLIVFVTMGVLPPFYAFSSVAVYVILGLIGLPVFSQGGGIAYVFNPTFGYILGFLAAAPLMSFIFRKRHWLQNNLIRYSISAIIGIIVIYLLGVSYMYFVLNYYLAKPMSLGNAITYGCLMFLPADAFKAALAFGIVKLLQKSNLVAQ